MSSASIAASANGSTTGLIRASRLVRVATVHPVVRALTDLRSTAFDDAVPNVRSQDRHPHLGNFDVDSRVALPINLSVDNSHGDAGAEATPVPASPSECPASLAILDTRFFHSGWESVGEIIARLRG